jgi:ribosomal protein S21
MPVILATQEAEIRRITSQSQPRQTVLEILSRKTQKIGLVEWLKVKALSSSPSTTKKQKTKNKNKPNTRYLLCLFVFK